MNTGFESFFFFFLIPNPLNLQLGGQVVNPLKLTKWREMQDIGGIEASLNNLMSSKTAGATS